MTTETQWIDAPESLGGTLLLSGVLKLVHDRLGKKYNVIRRPAAAGMLAGHPAIEKIDYLPKGAPVLTVGRAEEGGACRSFQRLAELFGLELPAPETLYLPMDGVSDDRLAAMVPWQAKNVAIAPDSSSPGKMMSRSKWGEVAKALGDSGALVVQLGQGGAEKVKHAYSLAGVTSPKEALLLLKRMDLLITSDNFLMHAAHMTGTPAISLWGPTAAAVHGYAEHQAITEQTGSMDGIAASEIVDMALKTLGRSGDKK